jgi:hydrogenase maturation protease
MKEQPTLILGVGNLLMGDEGLGVHAVRELQKLEWPSHVSIVDGGTGGFALLEFFQTGTRIVLVDATRDGAPIGTINQFRATTVGDFPSALCAHDLGMQDLLRSAALLGKLPVVDVVTISIEEIIPMHMELSEPVAAALPGAVERVRQLALLH